jgi:hypothetical protein
MPFDWSKCVAAFSDKHIERLAKWRGYSVEFCSWLKENGLVGLYDGCIAFPVHDRAGGNIVGAHYRPQNGKEWFYYPQGTKVRPLSVGELQPGDTIYVFESQWDAFAFVDPVFSAGVYLAMNSAFAGAEVVACQHLVDHPRLLGAQFRRRQPAMPYRLSSLLMEFVSRAFPPY